MEKKPKGVHWEVNVLQSVQDSRKTGENFSACVNRLIKDCKHQRPSNKDTEILQKLIPAFAKARLKVHLESEEQNRIKELFKQ